MADPRYRLTIEGYKLRKSDISGYKVIGEKTLRIFLSGQVIDIVKEKKDVFEQMLKTFEDTLDF